MRTNNSDTTRTTAGTENDEHGHRITAEEREALSLERILSTVDGMAVWGGEEDYERYK